MKIDALDFYYVKNPLISPWKTAYGEDYSIYTVLVKICSGETIAWSEACPLYAPTYSPEYAFGVYCVASQFLAPLVLGKNFDTAKEINEAMSMIKGNPFAHASIEIGWWVLESKLRGVPLYQLLGGSEHEVETGADFGVQDSLDILLAKIDQAISNGYPRIKLKVKRGWDLEILKAVRSTFPKQVFHIDCNSGYTLDDIALFKKLDKLELAMIEQPLFHSDIVDHAKLQKLIDTPICLDESISSPYMAKKAIELGACKYINIKPGRSGGLLNSLKIHELCQEAGIGNWVGGMLESAVGAGICIALATLSNMTYPSDLFPSNNYFSQELTYGKIEHSSPGRMQPYQNPGNPFIPDEKILGERTVKHKHCHI